MDKRVAYIALGLLVILYLVGRKTHPELLQELQGKAVAVWNGKSAAHPTDSASGADQWERHREEVFSSRVAESKRRAIAKYPTLAVANSEMNIRFIFRYQWMVKDNNTRLRNPNWPELLADDCAAAAQPNTKAVAASKPEKPGAHPPAPAAADIAVR